MKINNQKRLPKKLLATVLALVIVIGVGYTVLAKKQSLWPFASDSNSRDSSQRNSDGQQPDSDTSSDKNNQTTSPTDTDQTIDATTPKTPINNDKMSDNTKNENEIGVTITSVQPIGGQIRISSLIEKVTNSGKCSLTIQNNENEYNQSAGIQAGPNGSTCKGFKVDTSKLGPGTWDITLKVITGDKTGQATKSYKVI